MAIMLGQDRVELLRLRVAELEAQLGKVAPAAAGWIPWDGGECPVDGDTKVDVRFRDGHEWALYSDELRWVHTGAMGDIIAYRPCE